MYDLEGGAYQRRPGCTTTRDAVVRGTGTGAERWRRRAGLPATLSRSLAMADSIARALDTLAGVSRSCGLTSPADTSLAISGSRSNSFAMSIVLLGAYPVLRACSTAIRDGTAAPVLSPACSGAICSGDTLKSAENCPGDAPLRDRRVRGARQAAP